MASKFSLINEDNGARLGQIITPRGIIDTPLLCLLVQQQPVKL